MEQEPEPVLHESYSESCIHTCCTENPTFNFENENATLENRLNALKGIMEELRTELSKERELWKKEVEDAIKNNRNQEQIYSCTCCDDENEYTNTSQTSNVEPTLNDMSILDYEQKLSIYQQALAKAHAEKRMHLRKHLAANAYKRRLLELENMCNMELLKVKQNVQNLQPLQAIASEWNFEQAENPSNLDDELTGGSTFTKNVQLKKPSVSALENFGHKVNSEIKELTSRLSPVHSSFGTASSLVLDEEDDALMMQRLQSLGWYWYNDKSNPAFNPLM